jgi:hypothetical protein
MVIIEDFNVNNVIKKVLEMSQVSAHYIQLVLVVERGKIFFYVVYLLKVHCTNILS